MVLSKLRGVISFPLILVDHPSAFEKKTLCWGREGEVAVAWRTYRDNEPDPHQPDQRGRPLGSWSAVGEMLIYFDNHRLILVAG